MISFFPTNKLQILATCFCIPGNNTSAIRYRQTPPPPPPAKARVTNPSQRGFPPPNAAHAMRPSRLPQGTTHQPRRAPPPPPPRNKFTPTFPPRPTSKPTTNNSPSPLVASLPKNRPPAQPVGISRAPISSGPPRPSFRPQQTAVSSPYSIHPSRKGFSDQDIMEEKRF